MPSGDFTNPRYFQENMFLTDKELYQKYGYCPKHDSSDFDTEEEWLAARDEERRLNGKYENDEF